MNKIFAVLFLIVIAIVGVILLEKNGKEKSSLSGLLDGKKLSVVATFYPMGEFARQIGGSFVNVRTVVPAGAEPHDFEPTGEQITVVHTADVFVLNGLGMDAWGEKIMPDLAKEGVRVAVFSDGIEPIQNPEGAEEGPLNPHVWLDPVLVRQQIEKIRDAFVAKDPDHADAYHQNTLAFQKKLDTLDGSYRAGLSSCSQNTVITSHDAFPYMAARYGFKSIPLSGIDPETEPTQAHLIQAAKIAKESNIRYIFFETLVSPKLSQTLAQEVGAQTLVFDPIEGIAPEDQVKGVNYLSVMEDNLKNLEMALECKT